MLVVLLMVVLLLVVLLLVMILLLVLLLVVLLLVMLFLLVLHLPLKANPGSEPDVVELWTPTQQYYSNYGVEQVNNR